MEHSPSPGCKAVDEEVLCYVATPLPSIRLVAEAAYTFIECWSWQVVQTT